MRDVGQLFPDLSGSEIFGDDFVGDEVGSCAGGVAFRPDDCCCGGHVSLGLDVVDVVDDGRSR